MLVIATSKGNAYHLITGILTQDRHGAWNAIQPHYSSHATRALIVQAYQTKLNNLVLDKDTSVSTFINDFKICCQNLEKHKEGYSETTKI